MADSVTTTETPASTPVVKPKRKRNTINQAHLDEMANSRKVAAAAADPAYAVVLAAVDLDPTLIPQINALADETEQKIGALVGTRAAKMDMTAQEKAARDALVAVIVPIQTAARRKYSGVDVAMRHAYFIGENLAHERLEEVQAAANAIQARLVSGANNAPAQDTLPGIKDAQIQALADAIQQYGDKDAGQGHKQKDAAATLETIQANIEKLAQLRHEIQLAAEQAYPWRTPGVRTIRETFLLPPDRPLPDGHR